MQWTNSLARWTLAGFAGAIVGYCILVMVEVATAPDLRMRFQLVGPDESSPGIELLQTIDLISANGPPPEPHDILLEVDGQPITTVLDFMRCQSDIKGRDAIPTAPGGAGSNVQPTGRMAEIAQPAIEGVLRGDGEPAESGRRSTMNFQELSSGFNGGSNSDRQKGTDWVSIKFRQRTNPEEIQTCRIKAQSVPLFDIGLTLVWFLLELVIFSVGGVAFWNRPYDDAARLFFAMCTVAFAAFVGGFHWWTLVGSFWLNIPFVACAVLLPAVILHFFLVYPRPKLPLTTWPSLVLTAIYLFPVLTIVTFLIVDGFLWFLLWTDHDANANVKLLLLNWLRLGTYTYICVAAFYFLVALAALTHSWLTTRNPIERNQVRWILPAGCSASLCIGYALYLAFFYREQFVLGGGRIPMFLASLVFMCAYAVGIVRYKLMLIDQIVNRGMWYYVLSYGATASVAFLIACGTMTIAVRKSHMLDQPPWVIAGILIVAVILMIWLRDWWQNFVDLRFFREKYRLDKALQRMNQAVGRLAESDFLSKRMLTSCRDVLTSELAAIYLRDAKTMTFRMAGAEGESSGLPVSFTAPEEFCEALQADSTLQRVTSGSRDSLTPIQSLLRLVKADLVHGLETNGEISGIVVLGKKQNGLMYSAEDLTFLTALGQITGIALHCANVHQNLKHLNEELKSKVDLIAQQRQQIAILQSEISTNRVETPSTGAAEFRRESIVGRGSALAQVLDMVRKVAPTESSVLVRGESGTGKELLAQAIHDNSLRREGPLISVHCAALSSSLLESELFGHVKGAFTGAHSDKQGRFELANGGTLFLDEIGDISPETQVKLLRVLQQREFEPVGGTKTIQADVRLIAATHQNLERLIAEGKFREDLYYRLNVISIHLPPLRERSEDTLDLAVSFLKAASTRGGKKIARFDDDALEALMRYAWPGNVRELQNVIERAVVLAERETVSLADLPFEIQNPSSALGVVGNGTAGLRSPASITDPNSSWLDDDPAFERQQLIEALESCNGNKTKAARRLGLPRSTYFSKLKKYGITDADSTDSPRYGRLPR